MQVTRHCNTFSMNTFECIFQCACFQFFVSFTILKRQRERERETHFHPQWSQRQDWTRLNPEAMNFTWVSYMGERDPNICAYSGALVGIAERPGLELGLQHMIWTPWVLMLCCNISTTFYFSLSSILH